LFALVSALWFHEHTDCLCEGSPAAQDIRARLQ